MCTLSIQSEIVIYGIQRINRPALTEARCLASRLCRANRWHCPEAMWGAALQRGGSQSFDDGFGARHSAGSELSAA